MLIKCVEWRARCAIFDANLRTTITIIVPNHHYHQLENLDNAQKLKFATFFPLILAWMLSSSSIFLLNFSYPLGWLFPTNLTWKNKNSSTKLHSCNCIPARKFLQGTRKAKNRWEIILDILRFCARASVYIKMHTENVLACKQANGTKLQIHLMVIVVHIQDSLWIDLFKSWEQKIEDARLHSICSIRMMISQTKCKWPLTAAMAELWSVHVLYRP